MNTELLERAFRDNGMRENNSFSKSNPKILELIQKYLPWINDDSKAAWCGMWMANVFEDLYLPIPPKPQAAINWLKVGDPIPNLDAADIGDIVVFWRYSKSDWRSHVGLYMGHSNTEVYVFGGNQDNMVTTRPYSIVKLRGIRRVCPSNTDVA